jgi:ornithine carbamoyltransferase
MKRDCLSLKEFTKEELLFLIDKAIEIKKRIQLRESYKPLEGVILGMIFEKSSTRTRLSFESGMKRLGGDAIFLSSRDIQLGRGETIEDSARVISSYVDIIMIRTFEHSRLMNFAQYASVPVINALTDLLHPCQVLADLVTIKERFGKLDGLKIAFIGDGNNMANSWIYAASLLGLNLSIAAPIDLSPSGVVMHEALEIAKSTNAQIELTQIPYSAAVNADVIYTDVWASMGEEEQTARKHALLKHYQVNSELVKDANRDYIFMHCLPAHRGEEVTSDIIDGEHSVVWDEAKNRTFAQLAVILKLLGRD